MGATRSLHTSQPAELHHCGSVLTKLGAGSGRLRSFFEQGHGGDGVQLGKRDHELTVDAKRLPTRRKESNEGSCGGRNLSDIDGAIRHLLAVVENDQHVAVTQRVGNGRGHWFGGPRTHSEHPADRRRDLFIPGNGGQFDEADAIWIRLQCCCANRPTKEARFLGRFKVYASSVQSGANSSSSPSAATCQTVTGSARSRRRWVPSSMPCHFAVSDAAFHA